MANIVLVLKLFLLISFWGSAHAKTDRIFTEVYLGEKRLDSYFERYQPLINHNIYNGQVSFKDDAFFQDFFKPYLFYPEIDYTHFFKSEVNSSLQCSNEFLAEHFDDIRYAYRLIALSYLIEADWHLNLLSRHFGFSNGCQFNLQNLMSTCRPKSNLMKNFVKRLTQYQPKYDEILPGKYKKEDWWREFKNKNYKYYSHYRLSRECKDCDHNNLPIYLRNSCENDNRIMNLICSEQDELYGLSKNLDAYYLISQSNIINTFNKRGEALGCLRRFTEVMSNKEVRFNEFINLFPPIQNFLRENHKERFIQGRVFFFGSSKEFEEKGLTDIHVKSQPFKMTKSQVLSDEEVVAVKKVEEKKPEVVKVSETKEIDQPDRGEVKEIPKALKSAFLLAAELRKSQNLDSVEVDMLKLKYDYVFSLNMINSLSERLKTFMTREALKEMMTYDKLGLKEGPVPLLFLKFMIDMQEHQGLWNLISVLGDKFYVSNEIDESFNPEAEFIHLVNNDSTGNQWALIILKP